MLAAGQEQQYEQCSPLCLPYKQYYTQHPRCQFSCIMPEKRQSWYFRKQMIVTEVICQAQIQRPAVLRGPQWFSSATHVGTPLRKVTNVRWNWDVKNGEFPKDYYSFSSLIPPFPLLKWNAQFPHQKQSDWAAQHLNEEGMTWMEITDPICWSTHRIGSRDLPLHTHLGLNRAGSSRPTGPLCHAGHAAAGSDTMLSAWMMWSLSVMLTATEHKPKAMVILWCPRASTAAACHTQPFLTNNQATNSPFFPTPLRNTGDPTQRFNIWQIWKKTAASLPKDELHICFKSCMQNQDYFFFWLRNKLSTVASALPRCSLCRLLTQQQWASPEWANMQVLSLSAWFSFPSFF